MEPAVEIPIYDERGNRTPLTVRVPDPPPAFWTRRDSGGEQLELRTMRVCRRFGCGCVWEDELAYVPVGAAG